MKARPPCRLAALGVVNALGADAETVWRRLLSGEPSQLSWNDALVPGRRLLVGAVSDPLPDVPAALARYACRNNRWRSRRSPRSRRPLREALARVGAARVGVVMGTSTSGVSDAEDAFRHQRVHGGLDPSFDYAQLEFGGARGVRGGAARRRRPGLHALHRLLVGRARARFGALAPRAWASATRSWPAQPTRSAGSPTNGFAALQAICEGVTNPCSRNRAGLTLGEGAAAFLLLARGRRHPAHRRRRVERGAPHVGARPDRRGRRGRHARRAPRRRPRARGHRLPEPPRHGHAAQRHHGVSGGRARCSGARSPCSSTKPLVGHTLGAAGALEAAFCWLVLARSEGGVLELPPHCWDGERDPEIPRAPPRRQGRERAAGRTAPRDDQLVRLRRQQLHARARALRVSGPAPTRAHVERWFAWSPGVEDARGVGGLGRGAAPARAGRPPRRRVPAGRCCGGAARRSPASC